MASFRVWRCGPLCESIAKGLALLQHEIIVITPKNGLYQNHTLKPYLRVGTALGTRHPIRTDQIVAGLTARAIASKVNLDKSVPDVIHSPP